MYEVRVKQIVPTVDEKNEKKPYGAIDQWLASFLCEEDAKEFIKKKEGEYAESNDFAFDGYSPIWYLVGDVHLCNPTSEPI